MTYTDATKRHDFVMLFDVKNGNPNGDPDAGNLPRVNPMTMRGLVTDVAIKRKVRDFVGGVMGMSIFIQSQHALNTLYFRAAREENGQPLRAPLPTDDSELVEWLSENTSEGFDMEETEEGQYVTYLGDARNSREISKALAGDLEVSREMSTKLNKIADALQADRKDKDGKTKPALGAKLRQDTKANLCRTYYDIRMFGAVLTGGTNAGQVRGPLQLTFAESIDPVLPNNAPITRSAITREADRRRKETEMGRKPFVPYGLYRAHGFFNPFLAKQTGATAGDLDLFWKALGAMFEFDRSAARGEMIMRRVHVFTHDSELGNAPSHKLFELIRVPPSKAESPQCFADYKVEAPADGPVPEFRGVTLTTVVN
jgi:CRISPR-associated protein Csd2